MTKLILTIALSVLFYNTAQAAWYSSPQVKLCDFVEEWEPSSSLSFSCYKTVANGSFERKAVSICKKFTKLGGAVSYYPSQSVEVVDCLKAIKNRNFSSKIISVCRDKATNTNSYSYAVQRLWRCLGESWLRD